jgi:nitrogen-specific signal transduction histidine kinase
MKELLLLIPSLEKLSLLLKSRLFNFKIKGEGSGLGLQLCKEIVDKHDGIITLNSIPGKTEFIIKIPII